MNLIMNFSKKNHEHKKNNRCFVSKTNLFKALRNFLFLPLFTLILFTSCQNEVSDIIETNTEETFVAESVLAQSMLRTATLDGSFDNIIDSANCISVNLPVTVIVNGITITIEAVEDYEVIEEIFDEFDNDNDHIEIVFPITIILNDYTEIVINNYDELHAFVEECLGENEDDDDIECIDFKYPISVSIFNSNFDFIETVQINDDEELYEFIEELEAGVFASINFPVTMILADGSEIEVNNNDELLAAIEAAEDACDEDDDNDWNDDDDENCTEEFVELALKECIWNIVSYNGDDTLANYDIDFNPNYGFTVSLNGDVIHDGSWTVSQDNDDLFIEFETSWEDLNGNWYVKDCDDDRFKLKIGDTYIVIERECEDDLDCSAQEISQNLKECIWYSGSDLTASNLNGPYMFIEDGTVKVTGSNGNILTGTWEVVLSDEGTFLVLNIPEAYEALSLHWEIIECEDDRLKMINGDHILVLEQDCSDPFECFSSIEFVICDDDTIDGFATFDLNKTYPNCPEDNVEVSYYLSGADAETKTNPLPTQYTNITNPQSIYARVQLAGGNLFEVFEVELYVENCNTSGCSEEQVDAYLMECHWEASSYNGDNQLVDYDIYFKPNQDLLVQGNGVSYLGVWSTAGNPANGVFVTIAQLEGPVQDLNGQWLVAECTEAQFVLTTNNVEMILERDCSTNNTDCTEDDINSFLSECDWNVVNYNGSDDLIIFDFNFNNDGTVLITGDGQTITAIWSTSTTGDGVWIEFSEVSAGNIQALTGNWIIIECVEDRLKFENDNNYVILERTCN